MSDFAPAYLAERLASFENVSRCWIAFSGGLDSTVLLTAAAVVRERLPGTLHAVHIDHGLQPDAAAWVAHCQAQCLALTIPLTIWHLQLRLRPGDSLEAVARTARYQAFAGLLDRDALLLTAHHRDDQAETLLLALLRGSGVPGLAAMPFVAALEPGRLVRPLLDVAHDSLVVYAKNQNLKWIDDPSNQALAQDRNYLRQRVLPLLRSRWPACATTLARSASHCAEAAQLTDRLAAQTLAGLAGARPGTLHLPGLARLDRPLQKAVLRRWLRQRQFLLPDTRQLARILDEILPARPDANPLVAWSGCEIRRYREELFALAPLPVPPSSTIAHLWPVGAGRTTLELPQRLGFLEWEFATDPPVGQSGERRRETLLLVRFGRLGETCRTPSGTHRCALKKRFQEAGIPVWLRPYVPLVFAGETLLAIAGVCRCLERDAPVQPLGRLRWRGHPWAEFAAQTGA